MQYVFDVEIAANEAEAACLLHSMQIEGSELFNCCGLFGGGVMMFFRRPAVAIDDPRESRRQQPA